jgi:aspartate-semialdehyde dehydrogenase
LAEERARKTNGVADRPLVAVVGADTMLGREIRQLLSEANPVPRIQLIAAAIPETEAVLSEQDDEPVVMVPLSSENLEHSRAAFLAGSAASSRRALKLNPKDGPVLIDLTGALEEQPQARLRAPSCEPPAEPAGPAAKLRPSSKTGTVSGIQVIAHPAAIALASVLSRIARRAAIRRSIVHVFEPASERGQRGIDELHQQTVAVLAFKKLKKNVFDSQLAFNLLAQYGEEAPEPLGLVEQRLERHLASLLAAYPSAALGDHRAIPMPSLRLIQAPVFHGHSFSLWIEFEENPGVKELASALADIGNGGGIDVRPDEPPSNAGIAGQSGLSAGAIAVDRNHPRACWMWMVADNLRLAAENAIAVAKENML